MGKAEIEDAAAPEQVGIRDTTGRGIPEGMTPEGRQEGIPEGKEPVVPEGMMLAGNAIAVEARRAAEKAKDFILLLMSGISSKTRLVQMKGRYKPRLRNDLVRNDKKKVLRVQTSRQDVSGYIR